MTLSLKCGSLPVARKRWRREPKNANVCRKQVMEGHVECLISFLYQRATTFATIRS